MNPGDPPYTSIFQGPGEIFPVESVPRRGALLRPVISSVSLVDVHFEISGWDKIDKVWVLNSTGF